MQCQTSNRFLGKNKSTTDFSRGSTETNKVRDQSGSCLDYNAIYRKALITREGSKQRPSAIFLPRDQSSLGKRCQCVSVKVAAYRAARWLCSSPREILLHVSFLLRGECACSLAEKEEQKKWKKAKRKQQKKWNAPSKIGAQLSRRPRTFCIREEAPCFSSARRNCNNAPRGISKQRDRYRGSSCFIDRSLREARRSFINAAESFAVPREMILDSLCMQFRYSRIYVSCCPRRVRCYYQYYHCGKDIRFGILEERNFE